MSYIISAKEVSKGYGNKTIIEKATFHISPQDKMALIGPNGIGKTTFCKILLEKESIDSGKLIINTSSEIGYLPQEINLDHSLSALEFIQSQMGLKKIQEKLQNTEQKLSDKKNELQNLLEEYQNLQELFEKKGGYDFDHRLQSVLSGLDLQKIDLNRKISSLSGGEQRRIALATLLLQAPDLLILDEPTNHLDFAGLKWLESYLKNYPGAYLLVSHDRYLLNQTVNTIFEISENTHGLLRFGGNYDEYLIEKEKSFLRSLKEFEEYEEELKSLKQQIKSSTFSKKAPSKRSDSNKIAYDRWGEHHEQSRKTAVDRLKKKLKDLQDSPPIRPISKTIIGLRFSIEPIKSNTLIEFRSAKKSFGENVIFSSVNKRIGPNERVALIGPNGIGKTTFLKIIANLEDLTSGQLILSSSIHTYYLDQFASNLNPQNTVLEEYQSICNKEEKDLRSDLHKFGLFDQDLIFTKVKDLSLGQKQKLNIAKMIASNANLLLLDEPTNHLDLDTIEKLEKALIDFKGSIIAVSHDRYFIKKIATDIWHIHDQTLLSENQGEVQEEFLFRK